MHTEAYKDKAFKYPENYTCQKSRVCGFYAYCLKLSKISAISTPQPVYVQNPRKSKTKHTHTHKKTAREKN